MHRGDDGDIKSSWPSLGPVDRGGLLGDWVFLAKTYFRIVAPMYLSKSRAAGTFTVIRNYTAVLHVHV